MDTKNIANHVIDSLGGTSAVAELCGLSTGAISQWRTSKFGIPKPWIKFFRATRPELFDGIPEGKEAA